MAGSSARSATGPGRVSICKTSRRSLEIAGPRRSTSAGQAPADMDSGGAMEETQARGHIEECPECGAITIRGQWAMDGARTLTDAARMLRDYAHELEHLRASGRELDRPIEDDYGFVRP